MQKTLNTYKEILKDKAFLGSIFVSVLIFFVSLVINYFAGMYATEKASNPVTDIILSNVRVFDVDTILVYTLNIFWLFLIFLFIYRPRKVPFILKSLALLIIIRALFINMTHIGVFTTHIPIDTTGIASYFTFTGDLFFSNHTGIPFLMCLIFWQQKTLRYIFLGASIFFGTLVLLGHLHYTIDVFSAFFITYTIYHLASKFFKKDKALFFIV